jgi:hypothetical protein
MIHPADGSSENEEEPTAAHRLLTTLYQAYHHPIGGLVLDALYMYAGISSESATFWLAGGGAAQR